MLSTRYIQSALATASTATHATSIAPGEDPTNVDKKHFLRLFTYIKNNKIIPEFLKSISTDDLKKEQANQLQLAIARGDNHADIFSDPNCSLYLLYLMQEQRVSFWHGITVYVYLLGLMQFTDKQPLKEEDKDVKMSNPFSVDRLVVDGKLTASAEYYLRNVVTRYTEFGYPINYSELVTFIFQLPPVEQWVFKVTHDRKIESEIRTRMSVSAINVLFIMAENISDQFCTTWIPSSMLINFFLQKISLTHMRRVPGFGIPGLETLIALHSGDEHSEALYSPFVKSNLAYTDPGRRPGPFGVWLHDLSHIFYSSLLEVTDRQVILKIFIPQLYVLLQEAKIHNDKPVVDKVNASVEEANDFNLTNIHNFRDPMTRMKLFLCRVFSASFTNLVFSQVMQYVHYKKQARLGDYPIDNLLFVIYKNYFHHPLFQQHIIIWDNHLLTKLDEMFNHHRKHNPIIREAIINLAKNVTQPMSLASTQNEENINWQAWLNLLESHQDSAELWEHARNDRESELLLLITRYNLMFYHPYVPMTDEKRLEFKSFLKGKIGAEYSTPESIENRTSLSI